MTQMNEPDPEEFTEERTQHRVRPNPVDAYGLEPEVAAAMGELTPQQMVVVATMTMVQRRAVALLALDIDDFEHSPLTAKQRQVAELWLRSTTPGGGR